MKAVSVKQMAKLDEVMENHYGIDLLIMMENAGKSLAVLTRTRFKKAKNIVILAGKGNNAGGGLVAARHLRNWGYQVEILLTSTKLKPAPTKQLAILKKMGIASMQSSKLSDTTLKNKIKKSGVVIDAMLGYNAIGKPRNEIARCIIASDGNKKIIALDIPTGLNPNTGKSSAMTIKAVATLTIALAKTGLTKSIAKKYVGKLYLADISVPLAWYKKQGIKQPLFKKDFIVKI